MSNEYKLSYSASEIDAKLKIIGTLSEEIADIGETIEQNNIALNANNEALSANSKVISDLLNIVDGSEVYY